MPYEMVRLHLLENKNNFAFIQDLFHQNSLSLKNDVIGELNGHKTDWTHALDVATILMKNEARINELLKTTAKNYYLTGVTINDLDIGLKPDVNR